MDRKGIPELQVTGYAIEQLAQDVVHPPVIHVLKECDKNESLFRC